MKSFLILMILVFSGTSLQAQDTKTRNDGELYVTNCKAQIRILNQTSNATGVAQIEEAIVATRCIAYIAGFVDRLTLDKVLGLKPESCEPNGVTFNQIAKVFVKYADDHPEKLYLPAVILLSEAMKAAFPCK